MTRLYNPETDPGFAVRLDHLSVNLGGQQIVKDVSLTIEPHEYVAVTGHSGAGKTMAANYMLGITDRDQPPQGGTVYYGDVDIYGLSPAQRNEFLAHRVGYAPQTPMLFPDMTARENVYMPGRLNRLPIREKLVEALADVLGIADKLDRLTRPLSGGEKQRVNILKAFATNPPYVLLDEPTSALNEEGKHAVNDSLATISQGLERTIVVITHEETSADRVVHMQDGRVVSDTKSDLQS